MNKFFGWMAAGMLCVALSGIATTQEPGGMAQGAAGPQRMQERVTREVFHELVTLPQLTIFDNLQYKVDGNKVTLTGQVVNPVLKDSAEKVVKKIEGVESVTTRLRSCPPRPTTTAFASGAGHL